LKQNLNAAPLILAYKIQNLLLEFQKSSGYFDVFIHNMRKLSPSYDEYFKKLDEANKILKQRYPETPTWHDAN
jgi:hypothetical protein